MPDPAQVSAPAIPAPQGVAGKPPGAQAPIGSSPATTPSPNRGFEAAGKQKLGLIVQGLEQLVPMLGVGSPEGEAVMKALNILSKHAPPGTNTPASEANQIQKMALANAQRGQQVASMRPQAPAAQAA